MKEWTLPVTFEVCGTVTITAKTIKDAIEKFYEEIDHIPLPKKYEYIDGSFSLSSDDLEYIESIQPEQKILKHKFYSIDLIWYDENNVPNTETTIYVMSKSNLNTVPLWELKNLDEIKKQMELHNCESIGDIRKISKEEEFYEKSENEFIEL